MITEFGLSPIHRDDADEAEKAAAVAENTTLRNSLFPENTLSARFTTTAGPDLRPVSGTVFAGSQPGEEQRLLWVRIDERLYPTGTQWRLNYFWVAANRCFAVYTLWHNPSIVPLLHTPSLVISKLRQGADLMTPGLAGPPFPPRAKKGAIVAIASTESPSVPVAVGVCEIDVSALQQVQGSKGHAVRTTHWAGDELWSWSAGGKPGGAAPESIPGWTLTEEDDIAQRVNDMDIEDEEQEGGVSIDQTTADVSHKNGTAAAGSEDVDFVEDVELEDKELSVKGELCQLHQQYVFSNITRNRRGLP